MNVYSRAVNVLVSNVILKFGWRLSADLRVTESRHCMIIIICRPRNICLWQLLLYYSHFDSYIPYMLSIIYAIVFTQLMLCSCIENFVFVFSCFFFIIFSFNCQLMFLFYFSNPYFRPSCAYIINSPNSDISWAPKRNAQDSKHFTF